MMEMGFRLYFEPYEGGQLISLEVSAGKPLGIRRIDSAVFTVGIPEKTDRIVLLGRNRLTTETRYPSELNLVAINGGNVFLSDRMSVLNERGISIIRNAMAIAGDEVQPVYQADDQRLPAVWQGDKALLMINWEDVPRKVSFSGLKYPITSDKPYVLEGDTITVSLLPHESFVAKLIGCKNLLQKGGL